MKKTFILFTLLASITCFSQNKDIEKLRELPIDSSITWMEKNRYTNTDNFLESSYSILKRGTKEGNNLKLGKIHSHIASWHGYNGFYPSDSVLHHTKQALHFYEKTGDSILIGNTYKTLAIDYLNTENMEKAQEALFKSLYIFKNLKDEEGLAGVYRVLAVTYRLSEDSEKSIEYASKAAAIYKNLSDDVSLAITYFDLIIGYTKLNQLEKAYNYADEALGLVSIDVPEEQFIPVRLYSYRGDVSIEAKDYDQALVDYTKAYTICKQLIGEERASSYRTEIGNTLRLQKKYKEALPHLHAGIDSYEDKENENIWLPYLHLSECYKAIGNDKLALEYFEKSSAIKTRMLEGEITNLETEAVIKYETAEKEETIAAQEATISQQKKMQLLYAIIAILLGITVISMYVAWRKISMKRKKLKSLNSILDKKNNQNELLLKEIHHRVKNNLELVKSLIALQSAQLDDPASKEAMLKSQNRVQSMGLLHQKLYTGDKLGAIEMKEYFINLSEEILDTYQADDKVKIECAMEQLELDIDTAVPIGLIVNELLTNALKYAFPDGQLGKVKLSLSKEEDDTLSLIVSDNGVGKSFNTKVKGTGFGSQLVSLLTTQLNGTYQEKKELGHSIYFKFKLNHAA